MALASVIADNESMLRADLQQYFGIDLDRAMDGEHSANHIAQLIEHMPQESRLARSVNKDSQWSLTDVLLAVLINNSLFDFFGLDVISQFAIELLSESINDTTAIFFETSVYRSKCCSKCEVTLT